MTYRGDYNASTDYNVGDVVRFADEGWFMLMTPTSAGTPCSNSLYWNRCGKIISTAAELISGAGNFDVLSRGRKSGTQVGIGSIAFGTGTEASGDYSQAFGYATTASGSQAFAEGSRAKATGQISHAEGSSTTASGGNSHAEGEDTTASGKGSHAEGDNTKAGGAGSHSEGIDTIADGKASHAEGIGTYAKKKSQHVFGEYNVADPSAGAGTNRGTYVEIVGNGTDENSKSNARTLDWAGNEALAGSLTLGAGTENAITITAAQLAQLLSMLPAV